MSEWIETTVGDLAASTRNALVGGPFGSNLVSKDYVDQGVPVIRGQNMGGRWVLGDFAYVSPEKARSLSANTARPGDIVFTQRGTLGQVALVPNDPFEAYVVSQSQMKLTVDPKKADSLFLYYLFSSPVQQEYIRQNSIQVGVPHTNLGILRDTPVCIPKEVDAQKVIARYLGSLDDKIELNRRMNETLEAMTRAIFQSWFVDFDPVRAKASGESADSICQRLGLTPELLALFPDSFEDSELGEIPKGWRVSPLGGLSSYLSRGLSPKYLEEGGVCVLNQKCIRDGKVSTARARRHDTSQRSISGRELVTGDILVNSTGTGTLGRVAQIMAIDEPTIVDSHVTVVRANPVACAPSYLSLTLMERQAEIEALGEGSTGQTELSRARLAALKVLAPPVHLMNAFDVRVKAFREASSRNDRQSITLAATRDTLLPKLLSGELPVDAAAAEGAV